MTSSARVDRARKGNEHDALLGDLYVTRTTYIFRPSHNVSPDWPTLLLNPALPEIQTQNDTACDMVSAIVVASHRSTDHIPSLPLPDDNILLLGLAHNQVAGCVSNVPARVTRVEEALSLSDLKKILHQCTPHEVLAVC